MEPYNQLRVGGRVHKPPHNCSRTLQHEPSAAGLKVSAAVALYHHLTAGVTVISLAATVGVGAAALGHAHHQLATLCFTCWQTGDLHFATDLCQQQIHRGGSSESREVAHGVGVVDLASMKNEGERGQGPHRSAQFGGHELLKGQGLYAAVNPLQQVLLIVEAQVGQVSGGNGGQIEHGVCRLN